MNTAKEGSLEDLMVAMDIVDTLRHRQGMVEHELDSENRRERLIDKVRDIYQAQGIEVSQEILEEGVRALEEERFSYKPSEPGFSNFLARIYISRGRWLKPLLLVIAVLLGLAIVNYYLNTYPEKQQLESLPSELTNTFTAIKKIAKDPQVVDQAQNWVTLANSALDLNEIKKAEGFYADLQEVKSVLEQSYSIRIVSRVGELSGVWRIPEANSNARNYYLIVEAVDRSGNVLSVPILNEENNSSKPVKQWGIRVSQSIFQQVSNDKSDDGIIQNNKVGSKSLGELNPKYLINTSGSSITEW